MNRDAIAQVLAEWRALRDAAADPDLEALRLAIALEDAVGATLSDDDLDLAVLTDPDAVAHRTAR